MLRRSSLTVIGLAVALLWTSVPVVAQSPKDIELKPGGLMMFTDGMATSYSVRNKSKKKPVWVMFETDGPAGANRCSTIRKLEPTASKLFHCPQPSITPGMAYPLSVAVYADERFGSLLAWYSGAFQVGEKDLEFARKGILGADITATTPLVDTGDDAAASPTLPAVFEKTWYQIPPKETTVGGLLKSAFSLKALRGYEEGAFTVESEALAFQNKERTIRIPFASITSVGLEILLPGQYEWIVVRFVGEDQQPQGAAFRDTGSPGAGDTGMMLLTLHRARRK